jgi:hypothetical protein
MQDNFCAGTIIILPNPQGQDDEGENKEEETTKQS